MNTKTKIEKNQSDKILNSLNPRSEYFNFELWSKEVRQQMLTALQEKSSSSQGKKTCEITARSLPNSQLRTNIK